MKKNIILVVLMLILGSSCFANGKLPVYPHSVENNQYNMLAAMTGFSEQFGEVHSYSVQGVPPANIIKWYKAKFPDYFVENEGNANVPGMNVTSLLLKKGKTLVGVSAIGQAGNTIYFVGKTVIPEETGETLPNSDATDKKAPIQRYPHSVMISYDLRKNQEDHFSMVYDIDYGTKDPYKKVANWFKKNLESNGWKLTSDSYEVGSISLDFKKNDDTVTIIISAPNESTAYTDIAVDYTMSRLPEHDLASGTDLIKRYPESKLVYYHKSTTTMPGISLSNIKADYLAPGTLDNVKQWYAKMLKPGFAYVHEDESSIEAGRKNGTVLKIEFIKYVKFTRVLIDYTAVTK